MKEELTRLIQQALDSLVAQGQLPDDIAPQVQIERTRDTSHGDLACNIALTLAKPARKNPRELATLICAALPASTLGGRVPKSPAPDSLIFPCPSAAARPWCAISWNRGIASVAAMRAAVARCRWNLSPPIPTGPLHVGHGRGAAVGDSLCRLLAATGWDVSSEFYYNDAGAQIDNLALSVQARCKGLGPEDPAWPEDGYRGDYIVELARAYLRGDKVDAQDQHVLGSGDPDNLEGIRKFAVAYLRREQDLDLQAFAVHFDLYFLESSLYRDGEVEATVQRLVAQGHTYEKDGALWLRTTDFGDDKDRVMRKSDGGYTYFLPDVAYHLNKWRRGFERVINEQGADHHGTVTRVRAGPAGPGTGYPRGLARTTSCTRWSLSCATARRSNCPSAPVAISPCAT